MNKKPKMNTLKEDFNEPLDRVQRGWLRRPVVVVGTLILVICCLLHGLYMGLAYTVEETVSFVKECW